MGLPIRLPIREAKRHAPRQSNPQHVSFFNSGPALCCVRGTNDRAIVASTKRRPVHGTRRTGQRPRRKSRLAGNPRQLAKDRGCQVSSHDAWPRPAAAAANPAQEKRRDIGRLKFCTVSTCRAASWKVVCFDQICSPDSRSMMHHRLGPAPGVGD